MCVSSLAFAGAILTSFLPLIGTSQFSDWGLYAHRHQNILKEFHCHCRLPPSLCMLPMASHCQSRLILAVPLDCQGPSHCLNTEMVYCVHLLKVIAASFGKVASSWFCPHLRLTMVFCVSSSFQGHRNLAKPQINGGEGNSLQTAYFSFMTRPRRKLEVNVLPCTCMVWES